MYTLNFMDFWSINQVIFKLLLDNCALFDVMIERMEFATTGLGDLLCRKKNRHIESWKTG
jgi:hypothetical protein